MANTLSDLAAEMERAKEEWRQTASIAIQDINHASAWGKAEAFEACAAMLRRYIADHGEG